MFIPNHLHLLVKGEIKVSTTSTEELNVWLTELVHKVGMEVLNGPHSVYCDHEGNEGITGTVVLSTSHASIHIWDAPNPKQFQFDLYSCKSFSPESVLTHIDERFDLVGCTWQLIDRNGEKFVVVAEG